MIGIVLAVIIGIIVIGLVFKLVKIAIIVAIAAGIFLVARNHFANKRLK